jgi:hypothetical protein
MFYTSIMNLGVGEVAPVNKVELIAVIPTMIVSSMISSIIIGALLNLILSISNENIETENLRDSSNVVMKAI